MLGHGSWRRGLGIVAVVALLLTACAGDEADDDAGPGAPDPNEAPDGSAGDLPLAVPPEVDEHAADWPLPGRDYENSRARRDSAITSATVADLELAWSVPLPGAAAFGNIATTPVILGDTVYVQDLQSNVWAVDVASGEVRWTHTYDRFQIGPNGVAVGYGRAYVAAGSSDIAALDLETGAELWSTRLTETETEGVDIQPQVVDGLVLASTVAISIIGQYQGGDRGVLWALDAQTGEPVWSFDTVADDDLWGNAEINSGGGSWYPPAVDVDLGLVYWGVGNPAPFPGTAEFPNGSSRPGPNLYTNSVVALDVRTGELVWHRQAVEHDLFDRDLQLTAIAEVPAEGDEDPQRLVIGTGKLGRVLALDPSTGALTGDTPVGIHRNDDLTELTGPTEVLPGLFGGVLTPPATADGTVYAAVLNAPSTHAPDREDFFAGAPLGTMPGQVVAVDAASGEIRWDTEIDGDLLGGTLVVADLVLTATFEGTILALDRATGEVVHTFDAPGGVNGWPAATADTIVWPVGLADPPRLVAYRLAIPGA